jgi:hypothetical protein
MKTRFTPVNTAFSAQNLKINRPGISICSHYFAFDQAKIPLEMVHRSIIDVSLTTIHA